MDDETKNTASEWARWKWKGTGLGRWHAVAEKGIGQDQSGAKHHVVILACGRVRTLPQVTAPRPEDNKCCPTCRELDDLRLSYVTQRKPVTVDATAKQPVTAGARP